MTGVDWSPLTRAIAARANIRYWWRDDDAVAQTDALDHLLRLSEDTQIPAHLAVIPGLLEPSLAPALQGTETRVLVHGWRHENHAPEWQKKAEFMRCGPAPVEEAAKGLRLLEDTFGPRCDPVFVPPWNRINATLFAPLAAVGYRGISAFAAPVDTTGLIQYNTHIDPIFWRGHRGLVDPDMLVAQTVSQITTHPHLPIGLLTHHLVHDRNVWNFCAAFLHVMRDAGAKPWTWESVS